MRNKVLALLLLLMIPLAGCRHSLSRLCVRQACYRIDVAEDAPSRERGLMFRDHLASKTGMLFVFDHEDIYPFWMKNMKFPIDILWLDNAMRVVYIASGVPACFKSPCQVYSPGVKAKYVLEIPAGDVDRNKIIIGDVLK